MKNYTADEIRDLLPSDAIEVVNRWLARGDGIAVYENVEMGHIEAGHHQFLSFGSPDAQLEVEQPPDRMPDLGNAINWRYQLQGTYRGEGL